MKHYKIRVSGRVQGVGFRWSCIRVARQMFITGFVKNSYDGSVYIEAEGEEEDLNKFIVWCRKGPDYAWVDDVDIVEGELNDYDSFDVRY